MENGERVTYVLLDGLKMDLSSLEAHSSASRPVPLPEGENFASSVRHCGTAGDVNILRSHVDPGFEVEDLQVRTSNSKTHDPMAWRVKRMLCYTQKMLRTFALVGR